MFLPATRPSFGAVWRVVSWCSRECTSVELVYVLVVQTGYIATNTPERSDELLKYQPFAEPFLLIGSIPGRGLYPTSLHRVDTR